MFCLVQNNLVIVRSSLVLLCGQIRLGQFMVGLYGLYGLRYATLGPGR
jgi:hypothetical protein